MVIRMSSAPGPAFPRKLANPSQIHAHNRQNNILVTRLYADCNEATEVTPESIEKKVRDNLKKVSNMAVMDTSGTPFPFAY